MTETEKEKKDLLQSHLNKLYLNKQVYINGRGGKKEVKRNRPTKTRNIVGGRVEECLCWAARSRVVEWSKRR